MAIDSRIKRSSVVAISALFLGAVIVPDGTIAKFDRQASGYGYGGITTDAVSVVYTYVTQESLALNAILHTVAISDIAHTLTLAPVTHTIQVK